MKFTIKNETGLHARPASLVVAESKKYKSEITFVKNGTNYNAKSIMSVMVMEGRCGDTIDIICEGEDRDEAMKGMLAVLESL
ncbi:MAG: HPr family phosphocarrier protein [Peptostreptococcaceae bacterium]|nr:HPr family phosphocarrier protein [Peptostreptococcaceae bacterium]